MNQFYRFWPSSRWRKIPQLNHPFIKIFSNDFFRPLKSGKKLRWEAYSNFHQRLLQKTWGRVNYGNRSSVWRQNAWLWSTSLKVKYDWENCFCPKKPKVKKAEKRRWCWDALFLTDFSCRLQAEHDGYLPWNNWIKLLYQKWLWFSNSNAPNSWLDFRQKLFEARKSWEKSVEKKVFCCWWCSKWTLKVLWEIDKKSWKEGVEISCVASLSIPIGMTKWTIPFYDKINLGTASQNGTFFSLVDMTMPHFFRVLNSNIAITKCIFSHSPFCIAFDIRTKLYAGATPLWIKIKSKNTNRLFF